jgi:DNA invertase Pin-like site-specific DNA recombinase
MRVAIYARVSTKDKGQDTENQLHQLRAFAEQHGPIYRVFTDQESGGKADRVEFKQLLLEAYQQQFDLRSVLAVGPLQPRGCLGHPALFEGVERPRRRL